MTQSILIADSDVEIVNVMRASFAQVQCRVPFVCDCETALYVLWR